MASVAIRPVGRGDYTLDPEIVYFNHASIGTIPRAVQEAHAEYLRVCETNPWLYMWGGAWDAALAAVRGKAAKLLGCDSGEVALTHNTTEGFNVLAAGLELDPGDEVLFSSLNHAGASVCWDHFAPSRGYRVRRFEIPLRRVPELGVDEVVALHTEQIRERTRVLVLPHIDNMVGLVHPVRELAAAAREAGVDFVAVDGAQAVGMMPVDVRRLGVDFYCASPHKWLQSPKGTGLMYVRADRRTALRPNWVTWGQQRWKGTVRVFEDYGTRDVPAVLALGDAIDFSAARTFERLRELGAHLRAAVEVTPRLEWRSPRAAELSCSLYAIAIEGRASGAAGEDLWNQHRIVTRAFGAPLDALRVSPNTFNTTAEIDRFVEVIRG